MKILICCAVFDTDQNERTAYTIETYKSLTKTINKSTTEIVFIDNASCDKTKKILKSIEKYEGIHIITNSKNVGTAEAINKGIHKYADKDTYVIKLDNDVTFGRYGWADEMVKCIEHDPSIGVLGLKRKDLPNQPDSNEYPTKLEFLKHELGEEWFIVEWCEDIIGTCIMINPKLRKEIGYLWQPSIYGYDDVLLCARSMISKYNNAFYPSVEIEHLDDGKNPFSDWKRKHAGIYLSQISGIIDDYQFGRKSIYYNPFE